MIFYSFVNSVEEKIYFQFWIFEGIQKQELFHMICMCLERVVSDSQLLPHHILSSLSTIDTIIRLAYSPTWIELILQPH